MSMLRPQRYWIVLVLVGALLTGCPRASTAPEETADTPGIGFPRIWMAKDVDAQGAPVSAGTDFSVSDPRVYVVAEIDQLATGSALFARWEKDGEAYEDSEVVQAESDISGGYVHFFLEPEEGQQFEPGSYRVVVHVNGQPAGESRFRILP